MLKKMSDKNKRKTWNDFHKEISKKRRGDTATKKKGPSPQSIMVQRMSSEPNKSKKYEPLDTRDFVDFTKYDELSIENVKDACEKFYELPGGSCDVLLSDRGPSCYLTEEQIAGKKFYLVRFLPNRPNNIAMPVDNRAKRVHSYGRDVALDSKISSPSSWGPSVSTLSHSRNVPHISMMRPKEKLNHLPPVPSSAFPKSVSIADLLDARKLIEPPSVTRLKLDLSAYDVAEKMWKPSGSIEVSKEDSHFAERGFRHAFLATSVNPGAQERWVIKVTKEEHLAQVTETFNIIIAQHT